MTDSEMLLVTGGAYGEAAAKRMLDLLAEDKWFAARCGVVMRLARRDFAKSYPGQTRTAIISNARLRRAGYPSIAALNEVLGHLGS